MKWNRLFGSFVPLKKQNPALGAFLSGVGSIGSSLFSQQAQADENQKNRDWQEKMWNKTNEYNSPKNQRKLLEEGGYNPYLYGNDYQGSGASLPGSPNSAPLPGIQNPMIGAADTFQKQTALLQNQSQLESNVEMQNAKTMQTISDTLIQAYKEGGQKLYDQTYDALQPIMERMQWSGSRAELLFNEQLRDMISARYNTDMDSLNKEWTYELGKKYDEQQIKSGLSKIEYDITEIVARLNTMHVQNEALIRQTAADIVVKAAEAFQLKKVGEKYEADTKTANLIRKSIDKIMKSKASQEEVNAYFAEANKASAGELVGFMTSQQGQDTRRRAYTNTIKWKSDAVLNAVDKGFSDWIKVSSGGSAGSYGSSETYSGSDYSSTLFGW